MWFNGLIPGKQTPVELTHAKWEYGNIINGEKQIDNLLGLGSFLLGFKRYDIIDYVCERLKTRVYENAEKIFDFTNKHHLHDIAFELADKLYEMPGKYKSFFALSGSDANEGAVKLAAAYHKIKGNHHKKKVISFNNSYHGSTFLNHNMGAALNVDPFYNLEKYHNTITIDKETNLLEYKWNDVMCVMVETASWANFFKPEPTNFWRHLRDIASQYDVLIIMDDIFCGGGKSGQFFGWNNNIIRPNIFTMGKAVSGGYFPLSITLYDQKVNDVLPKDFLWDHGFTNSFNSAGILSTLKYIDILEKENILQDVGISQDRAEKIFAECGYEVIGRFGSAYYIKKDEKILLFVIPLNGTIEYFNILKETLKK